MYLLPLFIFVEDGGVFVALSIEVVDELEEDVEGDESDDMADERLVGETDDFF